MESSLHVSVSDGHVGDNCVVTSEKSNICYCAICMTQANRADWQEHIKKPIHVNTLRRFDLIFEKSDTGVYCKACGMHFDWVTLETHADSHKITPWHVPRAVYKTLVENYLIERETEFYCKACKVFFPSLQAASHHVADKKHQTLIKARSSPDKTVSSKDCGVPHDSLVRTTLKGVASLDFGEKDLTEKDCKDEDESVYAFDLPCISVTLVEGKYRCRICSIEGVNKAGIESHVIGIRHTRAQKKYGCDNILLKDNGYYCRCCDLTLSNRELAYVHIAQMEHLARSANLLCVSLVFIDENHVRCRICNIANFDRANVASHVNGIRHATARKKYGCEYISLKNNVYYCRCCDSTLSSYELASDHIEERKHLSIAGLPCISVTFVDMHKFRCRICNIDNNSVTDVETHVQGERHAAFMKVYGCEYISIEDNAYYCRCCDLTLSSRKLASDHIETMTHLTIAKLPCIALTFFAINQLHCRICNVDSNSQTDLSTHLNGKRHTSAQEKYGCKYILFKDNAYYCRCCDSTLSSRKLASDHIEEEKHLSITNLPCIAVTFVGANQFHCTMCNVNSNSEKDLRTHVSGKQHATAQDKFGCEYIFFNDNLYYCKWCDITLSNRKLASDHVKDESHLSIHSLVYIAIKLVGVNQFYCRICDLEIDGRAGVDGHVKGIRHAAEQQKYRYEYISLKGNVYYCGCCDSTLSSRELAFDHLEDTEHQSIAKLPCVSITFVDANNFHCRICNVDSNSETDLQTHLNGKRHAAAQSEHGCEYIFFKDNLYYCKWCDITLSNRKLASDHVKDESHLSIHSLVYIAIKVVDVNQFYCRICNLEIDSRAGVDGHVKGIRHAAEQQKYRYEYISLKGNVYYCGCCDITLLSRELAFDHLEDTEHQSIAKLPCISITFVDANNFHCRICNVDSNSETDLQTHLNGKRHADAQEKFGCKCISLKGNVYYCRCCDLTLPNRKLASAHLEQEDHKIIIGISEKEKEDTQRDTVKRYCAICDCIIIGKSNFGEHVNGHKHQTRGREFHENLISFHKKTYRCKCCDCSISGHSNVHQHIAGGNHRRLLELSRQKETDNSKAITQLNTDAKNSKRKESNGTSGTTKFSSEMSRLKPSKKKSKKKNIFISEKGEMQCKVCNALIQGAENYHTHLTRHFCKDFVESEENEEIHETNDSIDSSQSEDRDGNYVTKTETSFDSTNRPESKETIRRKRIEKPLNMQSILDRFEFDADYIYSMKDKSADIALGMKLCYEVHENMIHCLVCQKVLVCTMKTYHKHLGGSEHCENLDEMEKDAELFHDLYDESSQLELALHYMQEMSNGLVCCFACNDHIDDFDDKIRNHMNNGNHIENCKKLWKNAEDNFINLRYTQCEWYGIETYWCVPCAKKYESEINFVSHLDSKDHDNILKRDKNSKTKLLFDFCEACAILWYGYRCTSAYHRDTEKHVWLARDGYHTSTEIPKSAKKFLRDSGKSTNEIVRHFENMSEKEREKEQTLIKDMEEAVRTKFIRAKAYMFGSRVTGLGSADSDIDVFLDCENMYHGESSSIDRIVNYMNVVETCLNAEPELWNVEEVLTMCRSPIIKARHRSTGLACDISFENGLAVENTTLIKYLNDICPPCRKMIIILREWLKLCDLSSSNRVTNYALYWYVIFFLQNEKMLPSIATLIRMNETSRVIAGWEVGVSRDFTCNQLECNLGINELLKRFFTFYANFDYRRSVACPLMGEAVPKRAFTTPQNLPAEMEPYKSRVKNSGTFFRIDSVMCIQDPFDLQHNLSKAVSKVYLNRFRKYCSNSARVMSEF